MPCDLHLFPCFTISFIFFYYSQEITLWSTTASWSGLKIMQEPLPCILWHCRLLFMAGLEGRGTLMMCDVGKLCHSSWGIQCVGTGSGLTYLSRIVRCVCQRRGLCEQPGAVQPVRFGCWMWWIQLKYFTAIADDCEIKAAPNWRIPWSRTDETLWYYLVFRWERCPCVCATFPAGIAASGAAVWPYQPCWYQYRRGVRQARNLPQELRSLGKPSNAGPCALGGFAGGPQVCQGSPVVPGSPNVPALCQTQVRS